MKDSLLAASIIAPIVAICVMAFGITAVVQHNGTIRETACVESGGSYVLTESGTGRECRK